MESLVLATPGYGQPLLRIQSDHVRIEKRLALLIRLKDHLRSSGCDDQARQTASHILSYLDDTAKQHHEDEELDLFPATIRAAPVPKRRLLRALVDHLAQQHRDLWSIWSVIRLQLLDVTDGRRAMLDAALCDSFHATYVAHIAHEERELLPMAQRCLADPVLELLGSRMAARRNIALPEPHIC